MNRPALNALLAYQQADEDGVMVLASRQAIHEVADDLGRYEQLKASSERYMLAVKRLGETSGYNKLTYFEAPVLKMPTEEMRTDAADRWLELNNAGEALTEAIMAVSIRERGDG